MELWWISLIFLVALTLVKGGYPPSTSYGYSAPKHNPYLPAPPGHTPNCAKHGMTYCEKIDTYPTETISYLLYKWGNTYQQFIKSESDRDFILISKTYGPAPYDAYKAPQGVSGGYADTPSSSYLPVKNNNNQGYQHNNQNNHRGSGGNFTNQNPGGGNKQYVASYYRNPNQHRYQREHQQGQGGYDYSFAIPPRDNQNQLMAAAVPPILHSIWWNHRDANNNMAFPHMGQYSYQNQRWRRRVKRQTSENSLCPIRSEYITPRAAMNNEGNWMFVVNMEDTQFVQQVRSEVCANGDGSQCTGLCSVPPGFSASCRQKYVQKRLVALDGTGRLLNNEVFWLPHCCACEVSQ